MTRYVALFRGINVGKAKRIAMADLRLLLVRLGFADVKTLLNSGNAIFTADAVPTRELATTIRRAVLETLAVDAHVVVKSAKDVAAIVKGNALDELATDPSRLLVAITDDARALSKVKALGEKSWGAERIHVGRNAAYLWCANGILESKAAVALLGGLAGAGTTRNWATVRKIHALMAEPLAAPPAPRRATRDRR
jgi:uncharacterized protein (DUF1697 family)